MDSVPLSCLLLVVRISHPDRLGVYADYSEVGAMLYISSHLTFLMLAIVPPISLGAVGTSPNYSYLCAFTSIAIRCSMAGI